MRSLMLLEAFRRQDLELKLYGMKGDAYGGIFMVPSPVDKAPLRVIASNGEGWDHVSVSREDRCPTWDEMSCIKSLFFRNDECAMQLHVPLRDHINIHPYCLHLWRPHAVAIPMPDPSMVGMKEEAENV